MSGFLQLMPTFVSGAHTLHNILIGATLVLAFAGLMMMVSQAFRENSLRLIWPTLSRLMIVVILIGSLSGWGDVLNGAVNDILAQMGLNQITGGIFQDYRDAVARKFGSDGASQPATATSPTLTNQQPTGIKLNHYGYSSDPNKDPNSLSGIGAFGFDSAPGSLVPLQSAALSSDVVQKYNLQPGQQFTINTENGPMTLTYADKTADWVQGSVDVYDPHMALADYQLSSVTSLNGGPITPQAQGGPFGWISKIADSLTIGLLWPLVHLLSLIAMGCMWLMMGVQQIFYTIEIAVSPIFIGFLMIPRLAGTATRFLCSLVGICLWPLAWAICDLLTKALIDIAINPTNNLGQSGFGLGAMVIGYWVVLAIWVIGSSLVAPLVVSGALIGGTSGIAGVLGATVGATAARASGGGILAAQIAAGAASAPISVASSSAMNTYQNFARRPTSTQPTNGANNGR